MILSPTRTHHTCGISLARLWCKPAQFTCLQQSLGLYVIISQSNTTSHKFSCHSSYTPRHKYSMIALLHLHTNGARRFGVSNFFPIPLFFRLFRLWHASSQWFDVIISPLSPPSPTILHHALLIPYPRDPTILNLTNGFIPDLCIKQGQTFFLLIPPCCHVLVTAVAVWYHTMGIVGFLNW